MDMLALNLDDLEVNSFTATTETDDSRQGTVFGQTTPRVCVSNPELTMCCPEEEDEKEMI